MQIIEIDVIEIIFSSALFINAMLFVPQAIKLLRVKHTGELSLITFGGFNLIQIAIILHGIILKDSLLIIGYSVSFLTCGSVTFLILWHQLKNKNRLALVNSDKNELAQENQTKMQYDTILLESIVTTSPGNAYWKDINGRYLGCNNNQLKAFNLDSLKECIGKIDAELQNVACAKNIMDNDKLVMLSGKPLTIEESLINKDGEKFIYLTNKIPLKNYEGKIIGVFGTSFDITQQIKKEEKDDLNDLFLANMIQEITGIKTNGHGNIKEHAKSIRDYFEGLIAVMPEHVYWKDKNGNYLGCNNQQAKSLSLAFRKDIVNKIPYDNLAKEQREELRKIDFKVMRSGQSLIVEEPGILEDGTEGVFLTHKVPLRDNNQQVIGLLGISLDITERKKSEQALKEAKEEAEKANQLKSQFIANMEHDLRTPSGGIAAKTKMLAEREIDQEKKETLELIANAGQQLLELLNNILEFDRINYGTLPILNKKLNINELVNKIVTLELPAAKEKGLSLTATHAADIPNILIGDDFRVGRILVNLISNAIKFTQKGFVEVRVVLADKRKDEAILSFIVKDSGMGIPKEKQDFIYEEFSRLDPSSRGIYQGPGLGLRIVKRFTKELNGEIEIESALGKGTTFICTLPFKLPLVQKGLKQIIEETKSPLKNQIGPPPTKQSSQAEIAKPSKIIEKAIYAHYKILLVEDEKIAQMIANTMLKEEFGCEIDVANTGKTTNELIKNNHYDLIFMDLGLPDCTGFDLAKSIRGKNKITPIIALTSHDDQEKKDKVTQVGMNDFIVKPLNHKKIQLIFDKWLHKKSLAPKFPQTTKPIKTTETSSKAKMQTIDLALGAKLVGGDEEFAKEMLAMLIDNLPEHQENMQNAFEKKNLDQLKNEVHKLHGGLCYCGTPHLKSIAKNLEVAINNKANNITQLYNNLLHEILAVKKEFKSL